MVGLGVTRRSVETSYVSKFDRGHVLVLLGYTTRRRRGSGVMDRGFCPVAYG